MSYNRTLNLPRTDFPMKANLAVREPEILRFWDEILIYRLVSRKNAGKAKFILHDGPPYANGDIHLGTTLNKVLKDLIVKFFSMSGYDAPYVPGWDCHGLPIEQQAIRKLGLDRHRLDPVEFRRQCAAYARKYVEIQKEEFRRLGVRADWERPYLTMEQEFEAVQIGIFGQMAERGYIYKGLKPVYWCMDCETALAEAEVEYQDVSSDSIYVKFPVKSARGLFPEEGSFVTIWTTTPWTLPANVAVAVHPDEDYVLMGTSQGRLVLAAALLGNVLRAMGLAEEDSNVRLIQTFKGSDLEGLTCHHPFLPRESVVILGRHVTMEQGSGCVHTAPGHGLEDYEVGQRYGLAIISPLDDRGRFTAEAGPELAGLYCQDANEKILGLLTERGLLLHSGTLLHPYPHCWRCKNPLVYRATSQWFASVEGFRKPALQAIEDVDWIPTWGRDRIHSMVAERSDWCISRQRVWGVPIPAFYCKNCSEIVLSQETVAHVQEVFREHGSQAWFSREPSGLLPPGFVCPQCGSSSFNKETDIMDVWFDSGVSHAAVLETRPDLSWPADLYLEGSDQHRGWFNSSLATAVATKGRAPYRMVLTHGYVVDEKGRKMSKSLGNGVDPMDVIKNMGADILRLWVASADYRRDVAASPGIMRQMTEAYRKIRNTCRFLLGNLYDFNPETDSVADRSLLELDRWAMLRLNHLVRQVTESYNRYEFHLIYHAVYRFCVTDLSAIYLDILKDRLYTEEAAGMSRRAAQTVLYRCLDTLMRLLTPILAFTTEEIYRYLPKPVGYPVSVQLLDWPQVQVQYLDDKLEAKWDRLLVAREVVAKALEQARDAKLIGNSLEASVDLYCNTQWYELLRKNQHDLASFFITSGARIHRSSEAKDPVVTSIPVTETEGLGVAVSRAEGEKCGRCWIYSPSVGSHPEDPDICDRCARVLKALPPDRLN